MQETSGLEALALWMYLDGVREDRTISRSSQHSKLPLRGCHQYELYVNVGSSNSNRALK